MNASIQGRSRYLDGLPPIELWGVAKEGRSPNLKGEVNSRSEAHRARRALKEKARQAKMSLKAFIRHQK